MANVQGRAGTGPRREQRHESRASSTYKHFLHELCESASLSEPEAERLAVAVVCVLEQRIFPTEAAHLEAQLPLKLRELAGRCELHDERRPERFGRDEFLQRVGEHIESGDRDVRELVEITLETICKHVTAGEVDDVLAELPKDIRELFPGR